MASNMFHTERLNAINTQTIPTSGSIPPGTIVKWDPGVGPLPSSGFLALYIAI